MTDDPRICAQPQVHGRKFCKFVERPPFHRGCEKDPELTMRRVNRSDSSGSSASHDARPRSLVEAEQTFAWLGVHAYAFPA
jgi:hypothetical protein